MDYSVTLHEVAILKSRLEALEARVARLEGGDRPRMNWKPKPHMAQNWDRKWFQDPKPFGFPTEPTPNLFRPAVEPTKFPFSGGCEPLINFISGATLNPDSKPMDV
jgi:hypothetical protein